MEQHDINSIAISLLTTMVTIWALWGQGWYLNRREQKRNEKPLEERYPSLEEFSPHFEVDPVEETIRPLVDFDRNESTFLAEGFSDLWYCRRHKYGLDSVILYTHDPRQDMMYFSCRHLRAEDLKPCWSSRRLLRSEFWEGTGGA